jgi:fluoride exporter
MRHAPLDQRRLPTIRHLAAVAAGGAIGGSLRHALTAAYGAEVGGFPWAVLGANVVGAYLLGLLLAGVPAPRRGWDLRPFLAAGVLGSFTTFSNLAFDVVMLQRVGTVALAVAYPVTSMVLGLAAAAAGIAVGTAVAGRRAAEMS